MSTTRIVTIVAATGAGLSAGVLFAFSAFVMNALGRLPTAEGIRAMQAINRAAPTPPFMLTLFGTGALCVGLSIATLAGDDGPNPWVIVATGAYLAGLVLTIAYHVPFNERLDALAPTSPEAGAFWQHYRTDWTRWNHVRTLTSATASVLLVTGSAP